MYVLNNLVYNDKLELFGLWRSRIFHTDMWDMLGFYWSSVLGHRSLCFAMCNHQKCIYHPNLQRDWVFNVKSVSITALPASICFKLPTQCPSQCVLMEHINLRTRGSAGNIKMTNVLGRWRIPSYLFKHLHLVAQTLCSTPHFHIIVNFNSAGFAKVCDWCWTQHSFWDRSHWFLWAQERNGFLLQG